jgi:hypothetical protein
MSATTRLYCYDGEVGDDPHAVQIELSPDDADRVRAEREAEPRPGRYALGVFVEVTDQQDGKRWKVASAPCGLGCHCAAVARPVE